MNQTAMPNREVEDLFREITGLPPHDKLRLAAELAEKRRWRMAVAVTDAAIVELKRLALADRVGGREEKTT